MSRFKKEPTGRLVVETPRDQLIFDALRRFGPLPTPYLFALTKHVGRDYYSLTERLKHLFHDTPFLTRPPEQTRTLRARANHVVSALTPAGWAKTTMRFPVAPRDPMAHRFMRSTVAASIALSLPDGYRFIAQDEIFAHASCPDTTRASKNPLAFPLPNGTWLEPDDLFGIEWEEDGKKRYRFFALEADRGTESIYATKLDKTAYGRKLEGYRHVLRHCRDHWGIPKLMVLTVTTSGDRARHMMEHLEGLTAETDAFLFKAKALFGATEWRVPPIMADLVSEPWQRAGKPPFFICGA